MAASRQVKCPMTHFGSSATFQMQMKASNLLFAMSSVADFMGKTRKDQEKPGKPILARLTFTKMP